MVRFYASLALLLLATVAFAAKWTWQASSGPVAGYEVEVKLRVRAVDAKGNVSEWSDESDWKRIAISGTPSILVECIEPEQVWHNQADLTKLRIIIEKQ